MGLADFLAEAGNHTAIGQVAQAFGGQTSKQKAVDDFINNQLPALADQIHKAGTKDDVAKAGQSLITGGLKAGINPQQLEHLMSMTVGPALQNLKTGEIDKLRTDYGAQPGLEASPRPESSPALVKGPNVPATPALPERPLDLNFAMRLGQATGANAEQFRQDIGIPTDIAGKQISNQKTQQAIDQENKTQEAIKGLPTVRPAEGQPSPQEVAQINRPGITQFVDQRAKPEDPLEAERRALLTAQAGAANAHALAALRMPTSGTGRTFNNEAELRKEFQGQSKNFQQVRDSYNRLATADTSTPAGSLVALYTFNKLMDPGARVTEQDYKSAATARPFLERLGISPDSVKSLWEGSKMTTSMRADFLARAKGLYDAEAQQHQKRVGEYSRVAKESGLNPSRVITDMEATGEAPATPAGQGRYSQGTPSGSGSGSGAQAGGAMDTLPSAKDHVGKIIRDTKTGQRMKSDGTKWVAIN